MRRPDRGAALILVLAAVAILTAVAVELAALSSADALRAARSSRQAAFRRLHDSGAEIARGLLYESEERPFTFWGEAWNREIRFTLRPNETGAVRLADESGKLNVARIYTHAGEAEARRRQLSRLFEYLRRRDTARAKEWREMESAVSRRLQSPEPLLTLDGFREAGLSQEQVFGPSGLARFLTAFGDGRVNVNTAPRAVLYALDEEFDDELVERIARYRGIGEGDPGKYKPFEDPKDLLLIDGIVVRVLIGTEFRVVRDLHERVKGAITVKSTCLSARVTAESDGRRREAWVFLKPDGGRIACEEIQP